MPSENTVNIVRQGATIKFVPDPPQAGVPDNAIQIGALDTVFWRNLDPEQDHQPKFSFKTLEDLARFQDGLPVATSSVIAFGDVSQTYNYVCARHPGETGQVVLKA